MREWADVAERVASTTRTSEKVAAVATYLASLETDDELATAAVFLSGRPFPERDPRTTGIGWAQIAAIAERIAGQGQGALFAAYNESSDIGTAVRDLLLAGGHEPDGPAADPDETATTFAEIAAARGAAAKATLMRRSAGACDPITARYLVRILASRAAHRAARGPPRGGDRQGVRARAIGRAMGRDAHR